MAMTNQEIILGECLLNGIEEPVNTYAGWKACGYHVKRGEKAAFCCQIWKPCQVKSKRKDTDGETVRKLILVKAYFFAASQVAPV